MATSVTLNGVSYSIPAVGESGWGTQVSSYLVSLATGVLSKAGGSFTLTADADFGANFGLKSIYYKSRGTVSTAGVVRLGNAESIGWRNAANGANKLLKVNSSDILEFDGSPIVTLALGSADTVLTMNASGTAYEFAKIDNDNVASAAAIAVNKLAALTVSRAVVSDGSGFVSAATTTSTQIGYLSAATGTTGTTSTNIVYSTSPTLITPALGTPSAAVLTNATGLPVASGISGLGSGVATFLATPSSANLISAVTDETGTGALVFANTPTLVTPVLGVASATSINSTTIPSSKTLVVTTDKLSVLAVTSSSELAGVISDETGSGALVFANTPTLVTPVLGVATATSINKTAITTPATSATLTISNGGSLITSGGHSITFTSTGPTNVTLPTSGTLAANSNATADAAGIITSFVPVIKSSEKVVSSAGYTILDNDGYNILMVTTGASNRTMVLPTLADNQGREITIIKADTGAGAVIVDGEGSETVNAALTFNLYTQYDKISLKATAGTWIVTSKIQTVVLIADTSSTAATTSAPFQFSNEIIDTAGVFATGVFTAPVAGVYRLSAATYSGGAFSLKSYVNGTAKYQGSVASATTPSTLNVAHNLVIGDTLEIRPDASVTANGAAGVNYIMITLLPGLGAE